MTPRARKTADENPLTIQRRELALERVGESDDDSASSITGLFQARLQQPHNRILPTLSLARKHH